MTTTLMETYDAQMIDYQNDHDIQMQASSSDPWFQDEAAMEDDGNLVDQPKVTITDAMPSIEVDMEAYIEDQHIEYDMADDHHGHNPTPGEPLDVDLLDASRVQSPFVTVASLPPVPSVEFPQPQLATHAIGIPSTPDLPLSVTPLPSLENAIAHNAFVEPISKVPAADSSADAPSTETGQLLAPSSSHVSEAVEHAAEAAVPSADEETSSEQHHSARHSSVASQSTTQTLPVTDSGGIPSTNVFGDDMNRNSSHPLNPVEELASQRESSESQKATEGPKMHAAGVTKPNTNDDSGTDANSDTRDPAARSASTGPRSTGLIEPAVTHEEIQDPEQENFVHIELPNEVPEEVYLDAPPPILLAIFSTDHPELSLFNPAGPLPNEDDSQERHVLLQQAPALYYEPLAHVFDVLRQDEYVSTVLEIHGNELAFDAYELELTISEDNIYAREISLHDIHILHASANLAGPLRLRLYIIGPRFIVRYHILQEGLTHLQVDESQDSDTQEEIGEEQPAPIDHSRGEYAETDGAVVIDPVHLETEEHSEDRPEEEHEDAEEDHYSAHDEAEETTAHAGEFDLSALPPFVDSPEDDEEGEKEGNEGSWSTAIITPDETTTDGRSVDRPVQSEMDDQAGLDATEPGEPEQVKDYVAPTEETPLELYADNEDTDTAAQVGTTNEHSEPQEDSDEVPANEGSELHPSDRTEKTPQLEYDNHTNEEVPPPTASADIDDNEEAQEQQCVGVQTNTNATEEKDLEDETWDDELDGEGDPDTTWEAEQDVGNESFSNESSVTLSSKASKRSFDEFGFENSDDEDLVTDSPGAKRARVV